MKRPALFLLALLCLSAPARADFAAGKRAYDTQDWRGAIINLRPLADAGDARAMIILGNMYQAGLGVGQDAEEAISLYTRAATEARNTDAMMALGAMHLNGDTGTASVVTAADWFREAAEHGSQMGAFYYATLILRGNKSETDDLKSDPYTAYKWFRIAAGQKQSAALSEDAEKMSAIVAKKFLSAEETTRADQEAKDWTPKQ